MLRNLLCPALLCLALSFVCLAQKNDQSQTKETQSKTYQEIERLEIAWNTINEQSDAEEMRQMLADDSYHVGPSGRVYDKTQDITTQRSARERKEATNSFPKFVTLERQIRLFKNVAIVTGLGGRLITKDGREMVTGQFRFIHVWEKRNGQWQLIIDQVTAVTNPRTTPQKTKQLPASRQQR